jgi:hypothetical protein
MGSHGRWTCCGRRPSPAISSRTVVFFADEVQTLYEADAEEGAPQCEAVANLLAVGKTDNCLGILAGSTSKVRSLVFRRHMNRAADPYRNYLDLNNSVYPTHTVAPLRTREEVRGVLRQLALRDGLDARGIDAELTDTYTDEVFFASGGVGRLLPLRLGGVPTEHCKAEFLGQFTSKPAFQVVMSRLFHDNGGLDGTT